MWWWGRAQDMRAQLKYTTASSKHVKAGAYQPWESGCSAALGLN